MDAVSALDAFALVNIADAVVIICDSANRAGTLAGTDQVGDRAVRACIRAHTALFALGGINSGPAFADRNRAETAGIDTCFTHTETTVIRYCIGGKRTLFTSCADDLHNVLGITFRIRIQRLGKADSLTDNRSLFVDTAAILCNRTGNKFHGESIQGFFIEIVFPFKLCHTLHNMMFQVHYCSIIGNHTNCLLNTKANRNCLLKKTMLVIIVSNRHRNRYCFFTIFFILFRYIFFRNHAGNYFNNFLTAFTICVKRIIPCVYTAFCKNPAHILKPCLPVLHCYLSAVTILLRSNRCTASFVFSAQSASTWR